MLLLLVLLGVLLAFAVRPLAALYLADRDVSTLRHQVVTGDLDEARDTAARLEQHLASAHRGATGRLWTAAASWPVVGDDVVAVRDLVGGLQVVARGAPVGLDAVAEVADGDLRSSDGGVDLDVVRRLEPTVAELAVITDQAWASVAHVDPDGLTWPLAGPVRGALDRLSSLRTAAAGAVTATRLLPDLLGGDQPRTYLLVVQNNAEVRATGGLPGSASLVTARDGTVDLDEQASAIDIRDDGTPIAPMLPGEQEAFSDLLVTDFRNTGFTPDFPRAASLMAAYAERSFGSEVDGVLSVDPVTLAEVLRATGPVRTVDDVVLDGDRAVRELLHEPYLRIPVNQDQDVFFAAAARDVLDALLASSGDEAALVGALGEAVAQRRLLFWSSDPGVQAELADLPVAGALPRDTGRPEIGFYLDDSTEAKMQFFLRRESDVVSQGCDADGRQLVTATMTLRSTFDDAEQDPETLPLSVVGPGTRAPVGTMAMQLRMFAPEGGRLTGLEVDGRRVEVGQVEVYGREATQLRIDLGPQEETEVVAVFEGAPGETGDPRLQWTPGMEWAPTQLVAPSRC